MENKLLSPRPSWSANTVKFCNVVGSVRIFCVYYSLVIWRDSELYCAHCRNYPSLVENACPSICLHFVCPSTLWLSSYISPKPLSPLFKLIPCPKSYRTPFLFGLTVLQQFIVLLCKLSDGYQNNFPCTNCVAHFQSLQ